jgi:hypothetical protein
MISTLKVILNGSSLKSKIQELAPQLDLIYWTTTKATLCSTTVWRLLFIQKRSQKYKELGGIETEQTLVTIKTKCEGTTHSQTTTTL